MLTLIDYLEEIRKDRRRGWARAYKDVLGQPLSDVLRFIKAVDIYGDLIMFESLVITATKKLKTDPLNYVLAVALQRWSEQEQTKLTANEEDIKASKAIERTQEAGRQLADKIEKAKRRNNDTSSSL